MEFKAAGSRLGIWKFLGSKGLESGEKGRAESDSVLGVWEADGEDSGFWGSGVDETFLIAPMSEFSTMLESANDVSEGESFLPLKIRVI